MPGIFISYRRSDTIAWAGRLHDSLEKHFPGVDIFMDIEAIPPGTKFSPYIRDAVGSCDVLFVLIGPNWLTAVDNEGNRRFDDPEDFVVLEIKAALERNVRVIPTLVGEASMPPKRTLPESLKPLCDFQNFVISDRSWQDDCARLAKHIQGVVHAPFAVPKARKWRKVVIACSTAAAIVFVVLFIWIQRPDPRLPSPKSSPIIPVKPSPVPVQPPDNQSPVPIAPKRAPLLDMGLDGKWELAKQIKGKISDPFAVELTRVGDDLKITFQPGNQMAMLTIGPNQMNFFSVSDKRINVNVNRDPSKQQGGWIMSVIEKNTNSNTEKHVGQGSIKISEDWHQFSGELTFLNNKKTLYMRMTISPGEKICVCAWGPADEPEAMIAEFRKL